MEAMNEVIAASLRRQGRGAKSRLAAAAGVNPSAVTQWVRGVSIPEPDRWPVIEVQLELDPGTLSSLSSTSDVAGIPAPIREAMKRLERQVAALQHEVEQLRTAADQPPPTSPQEPPASPPTKDQNP